MPTQPATQPGIPNPGHGYTYQWAALGAGDVGAIVTPDYVGAADRSAQMEGSFGSGTCTFEGSNDGINFHTLSNPIGTPLSFTAPGLMVTEACVVKRPRLIGRCRRCRRRYGAVAQTSERAS
jgi:hypothetical protein